MVVLLQYETDCLYCRKKLKVFKSNLDVKYKENLYGFSLCAPCKKFAVTDIDKILTLIKRWEGKKLKNLNNH